MDLIKEQIWTDIVPRYFKMIGGCKDPDSLKNPTHIFYNELAGLVFPNEMVVLTKMQQP